MKGSRENLSPRLRGWACLLAIAVVLPFSVGACIAPTEGSEEGSSGAASDDQKSADGDGVHATSTPSAGKGNPENPPTNGPGPVFGPVPSPWTPPSENNLGGIGGLGSGGTSSAEPLPSPWMGKGAASGASKPKE